MNSPAKRKVTERLSLVVTNGEEEKLLGVSELESGTGASQAKANFTII